MTVAAGHAPHLLYYPASGRGWTAQAAGYEAIGWARTTYDLVRICGWTLLVIGVVVITFALAQEVTRRDIWTDRRPLIP